MSKWTQKGESHTVKGYATTIWSRHDGEWKAIWHTASVVTQAAAQAR
jgi:hypothetical protein